MTLHVQTPLTRKKLVLDKYNPDTFRVISLDGEHREPIYRERIVYENTFIDPPREKLPAIYQRESEPILPITSLKRHFRANNPQPTRCGFLRENAATFNEPVCIAPGLRTHGPWWCHDVETCINVAPHTLDTTSRRDYQRKRTAASTRFENNPHKEGLLGAVPVNSIKARHGYPRVWKEKTSYEHIYNSRWDPNYTQRGRRHGAFVWDMVPHEKAKPFLDEEIQRLTTKKRLDNINDVNDSSIPAS